MKGWLFTKTHVPLKLIEKEDPKAGPGDVVLDVKACGLCHSDVGALEDPSWMNLITGAPLILGHECAGIVSEVGEGVSSLKLGDRVCVVPQNPDNPFDIIGYTRDGAYATKLLVPAHWCLPLPEHVSFVQGAVATDAGTTAHHGLFTVGGAKPGMKVGIIGVGGLGQFATQMAIISGCELYAADTNEEARKLAESLGCNKVYANANDLANDQLDLIVDFAGFDATVAAAAASVRPGGIVSVVGAGALGHKISVNLSDLISRGIQIRGSVGNARVDTKGVLDFFETGKLTPQLNVIQFDEVWEGIKRLQKGGVRGRIAAEV